MEQIWFNDPPNFINGSNYFIIWPSKDMSFEEQLNCLMRFAIYFAGIVFIIKQDANIMFIPIFMGVFTYYIYNIDTTNKNNEKKLLEKFNMMKDKRTNTRCIKPTAENPFMNVLMTDYAKNPERPSACKLTTKVKNEVKQHFDSTLFRDVDDIFHRNASDRQFYTTPITTIPNDQTSFAKWLYSTPPTCKEGNGDKCFRNVGRGVNI
jgi:hypothetical protein